VKVLGETTQTILTIFFLLEESQKACGCQIKNHVLFFIYVFLQIDTQLLEAADPWNVGLYFPFIFWMKPAENLSDMMISGS
jgi:hypothetical protein